ncbi:amidase [Streptomyces halobius]|uniref:Amidase n=1 Tax=Streptomyces halobius TaxID=2879846 RepID=A0ABY4MI99_9ACTN|nr:amidase [Streptomyces halobius]UQA97422.1 amidase [Streptomyces halobius]
MSLFELTLTQADEALTRGDLSPTELLRAFLDRADEVDPKCGVLAARFDDAAFTAAEQAEKRIARGERRGRLDGIPLTVKSLYDVAGLPTSAGSAVRTGPAAERDADAVAALREAGAVIFATTRMDEFGLGVDCPATTNPRAPERDTGGSSGGAAAAVVTGVSPVALGSDTGGSVRIPAAHCGAVGFKPTYGTISTTGMVPLSWSLDHVGALGRSVRDCATVIGALSGTTLPDAARTTLAGRRVGLATGPLFNQVSGEVADNVERARRLLTKTGVEVAPIELPFAELVSHAVRIIMMSEASSFHRPYMAEQFDAYGSTVRQRLEEGSLVPARDYIDAQRFRAKVLHAWREAWQDVDAVLMPTTAVAAVPRGEFWLPMEDGRTDLTPFAYTRFTHLANLTGLPAVSLPFGTSQDGVPFGLQLLGRPHDEQTLVAVAHEIETLAGGPWPQATSDSLPTASGA